HRCSVCDLQLPSQFKLQDHMNLHTGTRPYCCAECGKRFCQIYNYRVHLRTHAKTNRRPVNRLMCRVCRMGFASQGDLKAHLESTHFEKEFYECDQCKQVFTSLKACENHVKLHMVTPCFQCETCERNFPSMQRVTRHRRKKCRHLFKCTDCSLTFIRKTALLKHSFSHLGLLPYTCLRCHCHFRLAKLYRRHKCEPGRITCVACLREFLSQEDFEQHKKDTGCWGNQEPKTDEIRCLECGEKFDTKEELKKHAGAHQRVLNCAECGKGFRSALLLMSHMGGHAGQTPCLCQICGLGFPHQQNYESHFKTCGQTPPACMHCSASFSRPYQLLQHQRSEHAHKPPGFLCTECGRSFNSHSNLRIHLNVHTGARPYACPDCGKSFSQSGALKIHRRIHTGERPYSCEFCSRTFPHLSAVRTHERIHTGERPYHCSQCGKCFTQSGSLKIHTHRVHRGERPFVCSICGKGFSYQSGISFHYRTAH
uniref:C2H2-type domain-containing protein n=1 Tax=Tetraodon nigroviridis TaxID=99883 RepID=H3CRU6_TETNG